MNAGQCYEHFRQVNRMKAVDVLSLAQKTASRFLGGDFYFRGVMVTFSEYDLQVYGLLTEAKNTRAWLSFKRDYQSLITTYSIFRDDVLIGEFAILDKETGPDAGWKPNTLTTDSYLLEELDRILVTPLTASFIRNARIEHATDGEQPAVNTSRAQPGKPGRKRYPEDEEARKNRYQLGKSFDEVFEIWNPEREAKKDKKGNIIRDLVDPRASLRDILKLPPKDS